MSVEHASAAPRTRPDPRSREPAVEARSVWQVPPGPLGHAENLAFSRCGTLLVVVDSNGRFRCPHSVAFSRDGRLLAVTDAGGRFVSLYRRDAAAGVGAGGWSSDHDIQVVPTDAPLEEQEGGPKGVAFGPDVLAFCSPELGARMHRLAGALPPRSEDRP